MIVSYRDGAPLRVRDIGQAVTGPQDTTSAGWADGKRLSIGFARAEGAMNAPSIANSGRPANSSLGSRAI